MAPNQRRRPPRINLRNHPDQPEWLSHVNANVLKVKLAMAIVGLSSIHLLQTFINAANHSSETMLWQTMIHLTFVVSAVAPALIDRFLSPKSGGHEDRVVEGNGRDPDGKPEPVKAPG